MPDYTKCYHLEKYLFEDVSPRFAETSQLSAFDFFCIVIWKANRAKSKIAKRLLAKGFTDVTEAVAALVDDLVTAARKSDSIKERLRVLMTAWGFPLPMASAVLTVLYPDDFTVYDVRVCNSLNAFHDAQYKTSFESAWTGYSAYLARVRASAPELPELGAVFCPTTGSQHSGKLQHRT